MESGDSLPHSQVPATCPYLEADQSSQLPNCILKIHFNVILPSSPKFSMWSLSLGTFHQNPVFTSMVCHTCYLPRPSHSSRFDHPNNIWWAVQIIKLLVVLCSPLPCYLYFVTLRPSCLPQHPVLKHRQPVFLPHRKRPSFTPIQTNTKILVLCILTLFCLFLPRLLWEIRNCGFFT